MKATEHLIQIAGLIARKREDLLNDEEEQRLQNWINEKSGNQALYNHLLSSDEVLKDIEELGKVDTKAAFVSTWAKFNPVPKRRIYSMMPGAWKYAAAVLFLLAGVLGLYYTINYRQGTDSIASISTPGNSKAILITANKEEILLGESTDVISFHKNSGVKIVDSSAVLTYHSIRSLEAPLLSSEKNELITPRGGEYTVVLSDGTSVLLNSASRLVYPDNFAGSQREVELYGEGYFQVAKADKAFIVHTKNMDVQVYGTSFNVSVYDDEPSIHATLVEGSVGVKMRHNKNEREYKLVPGEQMKYTPDEGSIEVLPANIELITAWTKGMFRFDNEELGAILLKLSKWYDFEYQFMDAHLSSKAFTCDLPKYESISPILDMISSASDVEFTVKGKVLRVKEKE